MNGHEIVWTFEVGGWIKGKLVCNEPGIAKCRWQSTCDCEYFVGMEVDADGPFHISSDYGEYEAGIKHRMQFSGDCRVIPYMEDEGAHYLNASEVRDFVIATTSVRVEWSSDQESYLWTPTELPSLHNLEDFDTWLRHDQPEMTQP